MTAPNAPTGVASEHLKLTPTYSDGEFKATWPGLHPTVTQRRTYMNAFMNWYHPDPNPIEHERSLRESSEKVAAEGYILANRQPESSMAFEATVDYLVWKYWFGKLPKEQRPKYPWLGVEYPQTEDDTGSAKFAELRKERNGKKLVLPPRPPDHFYRQQEVVNRLRRAEKEHYGRD